MAKYINKYETVAAYEADAQKDYPNVSYIAATDEVVWMKEKDCSKDYLTFVALEDGTFKFSGNSINYSVDDGQTWTRLASNTDTPTVHIGDKILWKTSGLTPSYYTRFGKFMSTGKFDIEGNIMSLVSGDSFVSATTMVEYQFRELFLGNTNIVSAENLVLPATTLTSSCYSGMFQGCTSLTKAPKLPATTLAGVCYSNMFSNCTSLTKAPELPATTLAQSCYSSMFSNCTSLTTAPKLPATTLANNCYQNMFYGCTSLTTAPELPATTLASNCYQGMFFNCTSLTTAPELPATTLVFASYRDMFYGCTSLNSVTCLATDISPNYCTGNWLSNVSSTGTFTKAASMTGWRTGVNGIPDGWTVEDFQ